MRFGIDLGGTKIEIVALDEANQICLRERVATPRNDYCATVSAIVGLVNEAEKKLGVFARVGVGIPGAVSSKTGRIKNANSTWLIGEDLQSDLARALARPVRLANDANCFALSEAAQGAAMGARTVFGVIIGTGCGGGLVVDGQILNGVNAIAGEWGHNPLPWQKAGEYQQACYCGQSNCVETFLSGPGMAKRFAYSSGRVLSAHELVLAMRAGDDQAIAFMQRYYDWLAQGLASVINLFDPDVIVLGGGLSQVEELYTQVPKRWQQWVFSDEVVTQLKPPKFGDSSGVIGAAWLWGAAKNV
ncbi:MAG: ROK family protein [Thiomicrospira sp.]|jgi:fructokinase|nr:ROK family protein [Thiomicrospira sp.]